MEFIQLHMKGRHYMNLKEVDLKMVYKLWKSNLGFFKCFFRSSPFVSLQTYDDFVLKEDDESKCNAKVLNKIIENSDENSFIIVDLPLGEILDLALVLNNEYSIKPILNINLLFHPYGIIGDTNTISKIINNGLKLKKIITKKHAILIPYDRYDENLKTKKIIDKLNNQYGIGDEDLPYSSMLKKLGYNKVVILTECQVKEDLMEYINSINKDIRVEIIRVMS